MRTAVIGLEGPGGEDTVGLVVADRLARIGVDADVHPWRRPTIDLIDVVAQYDRVIFVGSAWAGVPAGTLHHDLDLANEVIAHTSGEALDVADVLELIEALGRAPDEVHFLLVEVGHDGTTAVSSAPVRAAIDDVVQRLDRALSRWRADTAW